MKMLLLLYLCIAILPIHAQSINPELKTLSKEQWLNDIDFFDKQLVKKHGNAFHFTTKEKYDSSIAALKHDVGQLQDFEIVVRLQQIAASIGDAHTYIHLPSNFKRFPIVLYWFGKQLYVIRTTAGYSQVLGTRLLAIDDHPLDEINDKIASLLSNDENESFRLTNSPAFIVIPEVLKTLGIISSTEKAVFKFETENGKEIKVEMGSARNDPKTVWVGAVENEPLFRQRITENFWFTYLNEINAVYVNFKSYDNLAANVDKVFELVKEKNAANFIIDMRQNGGGDYKKLRRQLIPSIQENNILNQKDHLFVISGRRTFSAAMNSVIDLKQQTNATIIGEPPGEKPNSWQENDEMTLPNSGLIVSYSTKYYKFLDKDVDAFEPDINIAPDWESYKKGIDPVMEKIKAMIGSK